MKARRRSGMSPRTEAMEPLRSVDQTRVHGLMEEYLAGNLPADEYYEAVCDLAVITVKQELADARDRRQRHHM